MLYMVDMKQLERRAFAHAFKVHIDNCEACGGPDDGCDVGQWMEHICFKLLSFDPYPIINDMREADESVVVSKSIEKGTDE